MPEGPQGKAGKWKWVGICLPAFTGSTPPNTESWPSCPLWPLPACLAARRMAQAQVSRLPSPSSLS